MTVDLRTRSDAHPEAVEVSSFFATTLPAALERLRSQPDPGAPLRPLLVEVGGDAWTLRYVEGAAVVAPGTPSPDEDVYAHVRLTDQQLIDLATDQVTPIGLMTAGTLDQPRGRIGHLLDWWLVLRRALDDGTATPISAIDLPEDLHRSFTLDDDPAELRSFLEQAGYLHLTGVFTAAEMAQISTDMDRAAPRYAPGDGRSWWATTDDGDRLVRMQGFDAHSPAAAALLDDGRFATIGAIAACGHEHVGLEDNRIEALFKPIGVTGGISDVPWHKDCSLGRHSYECCSLTVGVSVTGAGPTSGQLRVIAGSHRALTWPALLDVDTLGLPEVALPTETGDVTVHLSCTLHMAQPPTERERRVLYTSFTLPPVDPDAREQAKWRLMRTARESAPLTTSQPATT